MPLESLLTYNEPLGPTDQALVRLEADAGALVDESVAPFAEGLKRDPILLLGRKGSGKSSFFTEIKARCGHQQFRPVEQPPPSGLPIIVCLDAWEDFLGLQHYVAARYGTTLSLIDAELIPSEYFSSLWQDAIWDKIITHFYNYCHTRTYRDRLKAVEHYMNVGGRDSACTEKDAARILELAKANVLSFAVEQNSQIVLLLDCMERYPVRNITFSTVLSGLIQGIKRVHYWQPETLRVTFCLPEELEQYYRTRSDNIMKDYSSSYHRINWRPVELLQIVAHRTRLYMKEHNTKRFDNHVDADFHKRDQLKDFFNSFLPPLVLNEFNEQEDSIAYIVRHTHLLPRHILLLFNDIMVSAFDSKSDPLQIGNADIVSGVARAEKIVADHIIHPYTRLYPRLLAACDEILRDLPPIFTYAQGAPHGRRFSRIVEDDITDVWSTLFSIGIIGRVISEKQTHIRGSERYVHAEFYHNIKGRFSFSREGTYCFHPVFSKYYGLRRLVNGDARVVYPANLELSIDKMSS